MSSVGRGCDGGGTERADPHLIVDDRRPVSVDDFSIHPLFTKDLIQLMRSLIPPEHQLSVATAVVFYATRSGMGAATRRKVHCDG